MKLFWTLVAGAAIAAAAGAQTTEAQKAQQILALMPECGLACLQAEVAKSPCSPTDIACSCTNATLTGLVELCVAQSCTVRQQLTTKNTSETLCGAPVRDRTHAVSYSGVIGYVIAMIAYFLRMASKITFPCEGGLGWNNNLWWDDAVMTFAVGLVTPISAMSVVLAELGLGKDVWTLPFANITDILEIYYADEILYLTALPAIKVAMLLTYLRIFHSDRFKLWVYVAIGLNVAYTIAFVLVSIFQCNPLPLAWTHWDEEHNGTCNNINAQGWASAAFNIVLDVIVISLPLPQLWQMNLNNRKKFWVMVMFCTGFFVTIVSILRLQILIKFGSSSNLTWDYTSVGYWSTIELHAAVVAACMPAIRSLFRRYAPKLMGTNDASRAMNPSTGLSGRTAVSSGIGKYEPEVYVRPRDSDEENFIPLRDMNGDEIQPAPNRRSRSAPWSPAGKKF